MLQIHEKLMQARLSAGLTQDELAKKLGIKRSTYQYWEDKPPSIDKVKKVAKALGLDEDYFFVEQDEESPAKQYTKEALLIKLNEEYEDRIAELKQRMMNVDQLMINLKQMSENQAVMEARIELAVDLLAEVHPVLKKIQDPEEVAHALDIRFAPKLKAILKRGNHFGATDTASRS